ncbi:MAG TPA: adenosylcobinamide-GDP ribazoletransferase, partial [Rhodocyclaceae bacterium]|nr:adenosylcobinamide-GDP ribazoletransferase [Rhodocyclaceae bacterium]
LLGIGLAALATLWLGHKMVRRLGGYTGDLLGATQQASELAFYLGLSCLLL